MPAPWGAFLLCLCLSNTCHGFPNKVPDQLPDPLDQIIDPLLDYDRMDEEFDSRNRNGTGTGRCEPCEPELCPDTVGCRAGLVTDSCGCCQECGNLEGQACDPGDDNVFYGLCGTGLRCQAEEQQEEQEEQEEPLCVCEEQQALCGSDGRTYMNSCQFKEASFSDPKLKVKTKGPCKTVPIIKVAPQSQMNSTGSSVVFLCEVFAFPMALVEWRKEGQDVILPGDDPHLSVQSRGGPLKYELSSWLQIEGAGQGDSGTYRCVARNNLGSVSASAVLGILGAEELSSYLRESVSEMRELMEYSHPREYEEDYY